MIMTLYGLVTLALIIGFIALCTWAFSPKQRQQFSENAQIPFLKEHEVSSYREK